MRKIIIDPLDYQIPHIKNIRTTIKKYGICIDNSKVGSGKMYTALLYAQKYNYKVYIITDKNIVIQWETLCDRMDISVFNITNFRKVHNIEHGYNTSTYKNIADILLQNKKYNSLLIIDEIHIAKNFKTNIFISIYELLNKCNRKVHVLLTSATLYDKPTVIPFSISIEMMHKYNWISDHNNYIKNLCNQINDISNYKICYLDLFLFAYNYKKYLKGDLQKKYITLQMESTFEKNTIYKLTKVFIEPDIYSGVTLICPMIETMIKNINNNRGVLVIYNTKFAKFVLDFVISVNYTHRFINNLYTNENIDYVPKDCMDIIFDYVGTYNIRKKLAIEIGRCVYNSLNKLPINYNFCKKKLPSDITPDSNYIVDIIVGNMDELIYLSNIKNIYKIYSPLIIIILQIMKKVTFNKDRYKYTEYETNKFYNYNNKIDMLLTEIKKNNIYANIDMDIYINTYLLNPKNLVINKRILSHLDDNIPKEFINFINITNNNNRRKYNNRFNISDLFIEYTIYNNYVKNYYDISFDVFRLLYNCIGQECKYDGDIVNLKNNMNNLFRSTKNSIFVDLNPIAYFEIKYGMNGGKSYMKSFNITSNNNGDTRIKKYFYKIYKNIINYREQMKTMKKLNYKTIGYSKQTCKEKEKIFKDFRDGNINLLISTTKNLSVGVNLHNVNNKMPKTYIIMPDKDIDTSVQSAGRISRSQSKTIPIIESLLRYSLDNKKCYDNKLLKKIKEINVSDKFEITEM